MYHVQKHWLQRAAGDRPNEEHAFLAPLMRAVVLHMRPSERASCRLDLNNLRGATH